MCMSRPSVPAPTPLPAVATDVDASTREQRDRQKRGIQAMSGYKGTILNGPLGATGSPSPVKTVLGA